MYHFVDMLLLLVLRLRVAILFEQVLIRSEKEVILSLREHLEDGGEFWHGVQLLHDLLELVTLNVQGGFGDVELLLAAVDELALVGNQT